MFEFFKRDDKRNVFNDNIKASVLSFDYFHCVVRNSRSNENIDWLLLIMLSNRERISPTFRFIDKCDLAFNQIHGHNQSVSLFQVQLSIEGKYFVPLRNNLSLFFVCHYPVTY